MKVQELESEVIAEITEEKMDRIHDLLREKRLEIEATKKVLKELEKDYNKLLEMDIDDFIFPNLEPQNKPCLFGTYHHMTIFDESWKSDVQV